MAALWVVALHATRIVGEVVPDQVGEWYRFVAAPGFLGVDVFFVLSGFVISYNYAATFENRLEWREVGAFLWRRLARIYPAHLTLLLALLLVVRLAPVDLSSTEPDRWSTSQFLESLLLIQAWTGHPAAWNSVSWSLSCEWLAYLLFPILTALTLKRRQRARAEHLTIVIVGLLCLPTATAVWRPDLPGRLIVQVVCLFTAGCLLHDLDATAQSLPPVYRRPGVVAAVLVLAAGVCARLGASPYLVVPLVAPLIRGLARGEGALSRLLATGPMQYLGRISFSLYLTHYLWIWVVLSVVPPERWPEALFVRAAAAGAVVLAMFPIAALTYHLIEEPARRRAGRLLERSPPPAGRLDANSAVS